MTHISIKKLTSYHKTETPDVCLQRMPCITNTQSKHHHHLQRLMNILPLPYQNAFYVPDSGMLSACYYFVNCFSQNINIHCMSFPRIFNNSGFIPSGPADFLSFNLLDLLGDIICSNMWIFHVSYITDICFCLHIIMFV